MGESSLEFFLTCPVCLDVMSEPVSLSCHHNFCLRCLEEHWQLQRSRPCPLCRRRSSKQSLAVNFALRGLSHSFRHKLQQTANKQEEENPALGQREEESPAQTQTELQLQQHQQQQDQAWSMCSSHPQVLPLFCVDDCRPLCSLCERSLHPQHTVLRGEEAERRLEELISSQLQALNEDKQHCEELQHKYEQIQLYTEKQVAHCEQNIRALFFRLRKFLQEEEQRALCALREEQLHTRTKQEKIIGPELEKLRHKLRSVEKMIQELKEQLETHRYRPQPQQTSSWIIRPQARSETGLLLDEAKVLGNLDFRVWTRMKREVQHVPVVLDPNTASPDVSLSEDLSRLRYAERLNKDLPDVPERFCRNAIVLGSVGFSSGTHQWDVEVGDHHDWAIGVVTESVKRKQAHRASPGNGYLCLGHRKDQYSNGFKLLTVKKSPVKIRVKLDFNSGTLSFCDAHNDHMTSHMTPLCSHSVDKTSSTAKLFPFFSVGPSGDAQTKELRICVQSEDSPSPDDSSN